jgi:hypothetical protein
VAAHAVPSETQLLLADLPELHPHRPGDAATASARGRQRRRIGRHRAAAELVAAPWSARSGSGSVGAASSAQQHPKSYTSYQDGCIHEEGYAGESKDESRPYC